jgi:subtilisin family serine protease
MNKFMRRFILVPAALSMILTGCSPSVNAFRQGTMNESVQAVDDTKGETNIDNNDQWAISHIKGNVVWNINKQKKQIKVAVVDTGVDYNHPDLKNRVLINLGYNFLNNSKDTMDDNWHGTHVAGIIAADAENNIGISGVVGNFDVKIIPIKVLNSNGEGSSDIMAKGIKYAADMGADIINFSVGFDVRDDYIGDAIKYARSKGVFVVVSSGNNNINCDTSSPAGDLGAYAVSSVNSNNEKSIFSNYGYSVKIAAPGEAILSTVPGGGYDYRNGTSMAAPAVSGVAAMMKAVNPSLTPEQMEDILDKTAVDIMDKGRDDSTGYGLVNAQAAVIMAESF